MPPQIDEVSSSPLLNQVLIDHTTVLSCIVNGNPKPSVKWLVNGQSLTSTARQHVLAEGRQLEIVKAEVTDTGRYTCVASNEAGSADRDFHLEVLGQLVFLVKKIHINVWLTVIVRANVRLKVRFGLKLQCMQQQS